MPSDNNPIIGAIELGTSKVTAIVGEILPNNSLNIIGLGTAPSEGIKKSQIVDFSAASTVTQAALLAAEESSGARLSEIFLAQSGSHLKGFVNDGFTNVSSSDNCVRQHDIDNAIAQAKNKELTQDRVYIHHIRNQFILDDKPVANPLNMNGQRLQARYWSIHGDINKVRMPIQTVNAYGLKVQDIIISSLASASMVAEPSDKSGGCLVIDIGRGCTDYALYHNGYVVKTGAIPVAGDHITNDLALALRITHNQAEQLKLSHGQALYDESNSEKVLTPAQDNQPQRELSLYAIHRIIHERLHELFSLVADEVSQTISLESLVSGVILTGGTSHLINIDTLASNIFKLDVRLGENPHWAGSSLKNPEFSTPLGLLYYALKNRAGSTTHIQKRGFLTKFAKILKL